MTLMRRLRDRLSYANVTASLALFVALGGTSYAAVTLPRNSVGQKQLRDHAVGRPPSTCTTARTPSHFIS